MIPVNTENTAREFAEALEAGNTDQIERAWANSMDEIASKIKADYQELKDVQDAEILASRGYRQLTSPEKKWYQGLIEAGKTSKSAYQQFIDYTDENGETAEYMPETIIEDVFRYLEEEHPLLGAVNFQYVGYTTKWIIDDSTVQKGGWGDIDAAITDEIKGALKVITLDQNKYSAFCILPLGILDLGPTFIDGYVRAVLSDAIAYGLEDALVNGTGYKMPIGLKYNPNSAYTEGSGYEVKEAIKVTDFSPATYGSLVAQLAETESGKTRVFNEVTLICNMKDYLTKIMPATTILGADSAGYVSDLFPYPTNVIPSKCVNEGEAILCLLDEYTMAAGSTANGAIEYDDSIGFLDHTRAWRSVSYIAGRAYDNTCALLLDINDLDPAYITVKTVDDIEEA